jgi:adenosine kinase
MIITHGGEGCELHCDGEIVPIPAVKAEKIVDPTGCGDAFRAGLLFGLERGWGAETACRLGALLGSIKIAHAGPQHHDFSPSSIRSRYAEAFGENLPAFD